MAKCTGSANGVRLRGRAGDRSPRDAWAAAQGLEALDSPHIAKTEDYSLERPAFHVSALLGVGLNRYADTDALDTDRALLLFEQIVSAVSDAHDVGVVHRDIKPNNVVVSNDGSMAYLIDFGICQYSRGELIDLTTDEAFGNAAFAAPECSLGREEEPGPPCDVYSLGKLFYWMVSDGKYISRENLSSTAAERIVEDNSLIRLYLMRLVRGTVVEDPGLRWTTDQLLEEVRVTRRLIARVRCYERCGEVILTDGFGLGDEFNHTSSRSATSKDPRYGPNQQVVHLGRSLGDHDTGTAFVVPRSYDVRLETITLALDHRAGENILEVRIVSDDDKKPDLQDVVEAFTIVGDQSYLTSVETVRSKKHPRLRQGSRYWVLLSTPAPHSEIALWSAPLDFVPRSALIAERQDGGNGR